MRKKLLLFLVLLMTLLVACGKTKEEAKSNMVENSQENLSIIDKNKDKYNAYVDLFNSMGDSNPIAIFNTEYTKLFIDKEGKFKRATENKKIEIFGKNTESTFIMYDEVLEEAKKYIKENPSYSFDMNTEKIIALSGEIKKKILEIIDYYTNGAYLKDNYEKGIKLDEEYYSFLSEFAENVNIFIQEMKSLEKEANIKELEKLAEEGSVALFNLQKFVIETNTVFDILNDRNELTFSEEDINYLKETNTALVDTLKELENMTDEQLEKEEISKEKYQNIVKEMQEFTKYSTSVISSVEINRDERKLRKELEKFRESYSKFIKIYNLMIE